MKKDFFDKLIESSVSDALKFIYENSSEEFRRQKMEDELKFRYHHNKKLKKNDDGLNEKDEDEKDNDQKDDDEKSNDNLSSDQIAKELGIDKEKIAPGAKKMPSEKDKSSNSNNKVEEPPKVEIPTEEQMTAPTLEFVTSQINDMRSGSSMKDEIVSKNFKIYFDSLSEPEKKLLLIYSTALSQIIKGKQGADQAIKPQKYGITVTTNQKRNPVPEKSVDKSTDQKNSNDQTKNKETNKNEFSNPIIVGESRQIKNLILKLK